MPQILVTDDDPQTRLVVSDILERKGYSILMAKDGDEALKIIQDRSQELALLLTDLMMPGLRGTDLARRAVMFRPDIKVILMSGYGYESIESQLATGPNRFAYLEKPFTPDSLIHHVHGVLRL
jgi:two-component system, cell cycle sensor histidine kinase and response regulator CckA